MGFITRLDVGVGIRIEIGARPWSIIAAAAAVRYRRITRHANAAQDIAQQRSAPPAIHHRPVEPVDPAYFLQSRAHHMPSVSSALQRACDAVLTEVVSQLGDAKISGFLHETVDGEFMGGGIDVWNRSVRLRWPLIESSMTPS